MFLTNNFTQNELSTSQLVVATAGIILGGILYSLRQRNAHSYIDLSPGSAVVVSGASPGLGKATALYLCNKYGLTVFCGIRKLQDGDNLLRFADSSNGGKIIPIQLDITSLKECQAAAKIINDTDGVDRIHAIVCCAGVGLLSPIEIIDMDKLSQVMDVQVFGTVRLFQALAPLLRLSNNPRIVLCSSPVERMALPMMGANVLSRHATAGLAKLLEVETSGWRNAALNVVTVWPLGVTSGQSESQFPQLESLECLSAEAPADTPMAAYASVIHAMWNLWSKMGFEEGTKDAANRSSIIYPEHIAPTMAHAILLKYPPRHMIAGKGGPIPFISSLPTSLQILGLRKRLGLK